jgi:hypothetical protein
MKIIKAIFIVLLLACSQTLTAQVKIQTYKQEIVSKDETGTWVLVGKTNDNHTFIVKEDVIISTELNSPTYYVDSFTEKDDEFYIKGYDSKSNYFSMHIGLLEEYYVLSIIYANYGVIYYLR